MQAKDIKTGAVVNFHGAPVVIESVSVQSPSARGASTLYKFRGRNVVTRAKVDIALKGTESLDAADFVRRGAQIMYADATHLHLMDQSDYNQYSIDLEDVADELQYVRDGQDGILALIYNGQCVGIQIPASVDLVVRKCDPGVKGNSATSRTKPATLETGLVIHVPEFIKQGESIKVDTRTGAFLSRS